MLYTYFYWWLIVVDNPWKCWNSPYLNIRKHFDVLGSGRESVC